MNIFVFHDSPWQSALWLDDIRKNKMILEAAQMLSTAIRYNNPGVVFPVYKASYVNHPCSKWVRASRGNFKWCVDWMQAMGDQRGTPHKSLSLLPVFKEYCSDGYFPKEDTTPFVNCVRNQERGIDFSHVSDVSRAYRMYMIERWKETNIKLSWNHGVEPDWRYK